MVGIKLKILGYEDEDYDDERYQNDPDYADGVDDAMDELDW